MYKKLVNPHEDEVTELLQEGYTLHSTNAVPKTFNELYINEVWVIYHFIKYPKYELPTYPNIFYCSSKDSNYTKDSWYKS
jgi:hypothetical protein